MSLIFFFNPAFGAKIVQQVDLENLQCHYDIQINKWNLFFFFLLPTTGHAKHGCLISCLDNSKVLLMLSFCTSSTHPHPFSIQLPVRPPSPSLCFHHKLAQSSPGLQRSSLAPSNLLAHFCLTALSLMLLPWPKLPSKPLSAWIPFFLSF